LHFFHFHEIYAGGFCIFSLHEIFTNFTKFTNHDLREVKFHEVIDKDFIEFGVVKFMKRTPYTLKQEKRKF